MMICLKLNFSAPVLSDNSFGWHSFCTTLIPSRFLEVASETDKLTFSHGEDGIRLIFL